MGRPTTKRDRDLLALHTPQLLAVSCDRCWARAGEPCRSSLGNITRPHVGRTREAVTRG